MYQQTFSPPPPPHHIASPPPVGATSPSSFLSDQSSQLQGGGFRASPVSANSRQAYGFSPPPPSASGAFSPMPTATASSGRYNGGVGGAGMNGGGMGPNMNMGVSMPMGQSGSAGGGGTSGRNGARYPTSSSSSAYPHGQRQQGGPTNGYQSHLNPPLPIPPQQTPQQRYKGTLAPGTLIRVGDATVKIERYLSEGGYAHVYLTSSDVSIYPPKPKNGGASVGSASAGGRWGEKGYTQHCLKRIAFEDEKVWVDVRKEIEVMKALPPNPHLTQYLASAHSRLPSGGYEVFILMEFCSGGGIIDLLNKRLRDRLKEIEILNIFADVCEAVAAMHALRQPLLHRDLKIENVLSAPSGVQPTSQRPTSLTFKLCDFGSTTYPSNHPPANKIEAESLAMDLNKHTTLQYRSPEMVEPMLGWAVGLPSDVWALGVMLYKLCYYTTPFEEHGTLAIHLIASMLVDHPARRPSVFEVLKTAHEMSGTRPEIEYPTPIKSFSPPAQTSQPPRSSSTNLLDFTSPTPTSPPPAQPAMDMASMVQPQRRGRPTREPSQKSISSLGALPPMPQPPTVGTPGNNVPPTTKPPLQVTGERQGPGATPQKQPSVDAFGIPSAGKAAGASSGGAGGFGDAFGVSLASSKKEPSLDAFGAPKPSPPGGSSADQPEGGKSGVSSIAQRFGGGLPKPTPSFTDSFNGRAASGPKMATGKSPLPEMGNLSIHPDIPRTTSPASQSARSTINSQPEAKGIKGAAAGGSPDITFETRFPSIETLDSTPDEVSSRTGRQQSAHDLISPVKSPASDRPTLQAKASMMGHLTGDLAPPHMSTGRPGGMPQPRSTQVTGTAFKGIQGGMLSPSSATSGVKGDYFGSSQIQGQASGQQGLGAVGTGVSAISNQQDLMTGEGYQMLSGAQGENAEGGTGVGPGSERPTIVTSDSRGGVKDDDSSDDDVGPESATARYGRTKAGTREGDLRITTSTALDASGSSPVRSSIAARRAAFESGGKGDGAAGTGRDTSPTKRSSLLPTGDQNVGSPARSRPSSMFVPSSSAHLSTSPPDASVSAPVTAHEARPTHTRKGSIAEMASNYQTQPTSPVRERKDTLGKPAVAPKPSTSTSASTGSGLSKRPSVAAKPQALRRPTTDNAPPASPSAGRTSSPEKPRSQSPTKANVEPAPTTKSKPEMKPKPSFPGVSAQAVPKDGPKTSSAEPTHRSAAPSKHGEMPTVYGYSRTSSGRSFPIYDPAKMGKPVNASSGLGPGGNTSPPKVRSPLGEVAPSVVPGQSASGTSGDGNGKPGSPEKQQSVNSLIARWNQGGGK